MDHSQILKNMHNFPFYLLQRQFKFTISIVKLIATQFLYQAESTIHASSIEAFHSSVQVTLDGKIQAYIFEKSLTSLELFHVYCYIIARVQVIHSSRIVQCQHELHKIDFFLYKMIKRHLLSWIWYCLFFCVGCSVARICTILQFCILCEQHPCSICMRSKTLLSLSNDFRLHDYLLLLCDYKMHIIFIIAQS